MRHYTQGQQAFDTNGQMGRSGHIDQPLVDDFLTHEYFDLNPPKCVGRETFPEGLVTDFIKRAERRGLRPQDVVASITRVTAQSIVEHCMFAES